MYNKNCKGGRRRFFGKERPNTAQRVRTLCLLAISIALTTISTAPASAQQVSLLVNLTAVHLDNPPGTDFNENNFGLGLQYDFEATRNNWIPFVSASGFEDSNRNPSYYAGGGALRRFSFGKEKKLNVDLGVVGFLMVRKDFNSGNPFPGILPVLSVGTDRVALNMTYVPKIDPKMVPLVFFQLKIGIN